MDGLGSPDSLMDHSMLDIKNSSPYACYSPKLSYDVFPTNRGKQGNNSGAEEYNNLLAGLNIGGIKNEAIWHLNQNYPGYSGSPGHYGLANPNITSNTVM